MVTRGEKGGGRLSTGLRGTGVRASAGKNVTFGTGPGPWIGAQGGEDRLKSGVCGSPNFSQRSEPGLLEHSDGVLQWAVAVDRTARTAQSAMIVPSCAALPVGALI